MKKKITIITTGAIIIIALCWFLWVKVASPTKIALVNFQNFQVAKMVKSADGFIDAKQLTIDDFKKLKRYDAVLIFAMGIRMTDEHRAILEELKAKGVPVYSTAVTDPVNNISSLDSVQAKRVAEYLGNGGKSNYKSLFNYIRKELTGKSLFTGEILEPVTISANLLFHLDEERFFETVEEFERYYKESGYYTENGAKVAIITGIAGPFDSDKGYLDSLITSLERKNLNVYAFSSVAKRMEYLTQIDPDAVIYFPHGRMMMGQADMAVEWLKMKNIPLFCPITLNATYDDWMNDPQGMVGGFLSQSVVMPELDGGIVPTALVAQYIDKEGLYIFKAIPERLEQFTSTIDNYINLKRLKNHEKRVAIYYFKGPGNSTLSASGLEVIPSLYNLMKKLQQEGYLVKNLPATEKEFEKMIMEQGPLFNSYAEGNYNRFVEAGHPMLVESSEYDGWLKKTLLPAKYDELIAKHGPAPGNFYSTVKGNKKYLVIPRIDFGNIILLPQPTQGTGENSFAAVHGDNPVPPHHYLASYLWVKNGFKANAMIHFGTHGSLEFIPGKQVALSSADWSDRIVNDLPHFYYYSIANVGEGIIAKRRSYATLISHLNPPFMETGLRKEIAGLQHEISSYLAKEKRPEKDNLKIKGMAIKMGLHRDLKLDSVLTKPYEDFEIEKINDFAEELCAEKIIAGAYILGQTFEEKKVLSSVELMCVDPIAYSLADLDRQQGKVTQEKLDNKVYFNQNYGNKANNIVKRALANPKLSTDELLTSLGISKADIEKAEKLQEMMQPRMGRMMAAMMEQAKKEDKKSSGGHPAWIPKSGDSKMPEEAKKRAEAAKKEETKAAMPTAEKESVSKEDREFAEAIMTVKRTVENINYYRQSLRESPQIELSSIVRGLNGGYIAPSSGGDFIANPLTVPTGRNLFSINAEATPSAKAWEKGVALAQGIIEDYKSNHNGEYPKKISVTLWSGSFIESEGASIAQLLYLLGVEPIRDQFGRVLDVRLISEETLKRPRIDVVVQTSGQFRDLAASRLSLLQKAIDMAAEAQDKTTNYVAEGKHSAERVLLDKGFSPKEARELSTTRIFGGINGMAGTGITGMVQNSDRWEEESEIAKVYLNNMGATYGNSESWGNFREGVFEAALQNTDVVVQPRQSNTWGALSLDHVYEFMGGMTLTVRNVTGKDPDNYFNDLRNRHNARVQTLSSAIGVESRTTILNPNYIREQLKSGATAASGMAEIVSNTFGWNVMKPTAIDDQLWNDIYDVYIEDIHHLGINEFFENESPTALQEITAIMLETARKGYWDASPAQLDKMAAVHAESITKHEAGCTEFICDNAKLRDYLTSRLESNTKEQYNTAINKARQVGSAANAQGVVMEKEELTDGQQQRTSDRTSDATNATQAILVTLGALVLVTLIIVIVAKKRRKNNG